jgi:hypothetical protein
MSGIVPEAIGAKNDGTWSYVLGHSGDPKTERLAFDPGEGCGYTTHAFHHASLVCEYVTGMPYDRFAIEHLFRPIGCEHWWFQYFDDAKIGRHPSHAMGMPARDLARIAYCMLRGGRWGERQVIPRWFVDGIAAPATPRGHKEMRWGRDSAATAEAWELPMWLTDESAPGRGVVPADARFTGTNRHPRGPLASEPSRLHRHHARPGRDVQFAEEDLHAVEDIHVHAVDGMDVSGPELRRVAMQDVFPVAGRVHPLLQEAFGKREIRVRRDRLPAGFVAEDRPAVLLAREDGRARLVPQPESHRHVLRREGGRRRRDLPEPIAQRAQGGIRMAVGDVAAARHPRSLDPGGFAQRGAIAEDREPVPGAAAVGFVKHGGREQRAIDVGEVDRLGRGSEVAEALEREIAMQAFRARELGCRRPLGPRFRCDGRRGEQAGEDQAPDETTHDRTMHAGPRAAR